MRHPEYLIKPVNLFIQLAIVQKFECLNNNKSLALLQVFSKLKVYIGEEV